MTGPISATCGSAGVDSVTSLSVTALGLDCALALPDSSAWLEPGVEIAAAVWVGGVVAVVAVAAVVVGEVLRLENNAISSSRTSLQEHLACFLVQPRQAVRFLRQAI